MLTDDDIDRVRACVLHEPLGAGGPTLAEWLIRLSSTVDTIRSAVDGLRGGPIADPEVMADALQAALPRLSDTAVARLAHAYAGELARRGWTSGGDLCSGEI